MAEVFGLKADVYLGHPDMPLPDWREYAESDEEADDEADEEQPGVNALLGFDPDELDDTDETDPELSKGFRSLMKSAEEFWRDGSDYP